MPKGVYKKSKEHIEKLAKIHTGYRHTQEVRKKMSEIRKNNPNRYWLGKKHTQETRTKISRSRKGKMVGENNWIWKGGKSHTKQYRAFAESRRRARKTGNGGWHSFEQWEILKAQYNFTCPCCGQQEPKITLGKDHIIPLSMGGSDNIENIQPLCRLCNMRKHTKCTKYEKR